MVDEQEVAQSEMETAEVIAAEEAVPQQPKQFYIAKNKETADQKPSKLQQVKDFFVECKRVVRVTKKPDIEELKTIVKISGLGMLLIGLVGFLIHLSKEVFLR